ncbi:MAG TPA: IS4 family transposase [Microscillaceae bacterium]|nr:IS4 family transposase [Microscillaceae bacterium]
MDSQAINKISTSILGKPYLGVLQEILSTTHLDQLGKDLGFTHRSTAKVRGSHFFDLHVSHLPNASLADRSLQGMCDYLWEHHGVQLLRSSLDDRFTPKAVSFMKSCFELILEQFISQITAQLPFSLGLRGLILTDSVVFRLADQLSDIYPGTQGRSKSKAAAKLHYSFDLLSSKAPQITITSSTDNDVNHWKRVSFEPGYMYLQDLGYFSTNAYKTLDQAGAYFLSRYKTGTGLYNQDAQGKYHPVDFEEMLGKHQPASTYLPEVFVGKREKVKCRLLLSPVPEDVKQARIKKAEAQYKTRKTKEGKSPKVSDLKKKLCGYNIYITNADEQKLPTSLIFAFYSLSWQIELLFKVWKSLFGLDNLPKMDIYRFECYLYGQLISLFLCTSFKDIIQAEAAQYVEEDDIIEISHWKALRILKKKLPPQKSTSERNQEG